MTSHLKAMITTLTLIISLSSAQTPDFEAILAKIDQQTTFSTDLTATMQLESQDPKEGTEVQKVQIFRQDATEKFLLLIQEPITQLGQGYLNIEDGLWFYDPESRKFSYTSLSEAFSGSDARNSDFGASTLAKDYKVIGSNEGQLGNFEVWILELEAKSNEVTYPFKTIYVTKDSTLLLKSEDYSLTKRLLRTGYFTSYTKAGESFIADKVMFVDALVENKSTRFSLANISTASIPDNIFTKAYVERVNR
jgi:outer membrane lipoprotein-sorting protein